MNTIIANYMFLLFIINIINATDSAHTVRMLSAEKDLADQINTYTCIILDNPDTNKISSALVLNIDYFKLRYPSEDDSKIRELPEILSLYQYDYKDIKELDIFRDMDSIKNSKFEKESIIRIPLLPRFFPLEISDDLDGDINSYWLKYSYGFNEKNVEPTGCINEIKGRYFEITVHFYVIVTEDGIATVNKKSFADLKEREGDDIIDVRTFSSLFDSNYAEINK